MNTMNQVILEGNVVRAPQVKDTPRGMKLSLLPIAVNRLYRDKDGNDTKEVGYYDIEAWGDKLANSIEKCGWKGRGVRVVGRLKQSRWKNDEGKQMSKITIVAEHVDFKPVFHKKDGDDSAEENLAEAAEGIREEQEVSEEVF